MKETDVMGVIEGATAAKKKAALNQHPLIKN